MKIKAVCILGVSVLASGLWMQAQSTASVTFGSLAQTIRGFGGSTAWEPELTTAQANALFSNGSTSQMGMSILRVRIDPGGSANWATELANAQEAAARGASIIATPWTPPASMKSNSSTIGGTLNTSEYSAYATFLNSFVTYMSNGGVTLYGISMQNEPDASVDYESCSWTPAEMETWVADYGGTIKTRLIMPEAEGFSTAYSDPTLDNSTAAANVSIIAGHLYGATPFYYTLAKNMGKQTWVTEHYLTGSGITGALALAREVHDSMVTGQYNAYLWWWIANWSAESYTYGLVDSSGNPTMNGYAMGHFSKFVRPGYSRANATANPNSGIYVSAYTGSGHYVIVAINNGTSAVNQPFSLSGATIPSITPYQTTSSASMAQKSAVTVSSNAFTYTLPAQSITTFYY